MKDHLGAAMGVLALLILVLIFVLGLWALWQWPLLARCV